MNLQRGLVAHYIFSKVSELDDNISNERKTKEKTLKNQQKLWIRDKCIKYCYL